MTSARMTVVRRWVPGAVWLGLFAFHVFCAGGAVVPYRDTGEMVVDAHTLGVAHPPGYPLYTLAGKAFGLISLGNPAYRLNVFSAFAAAFLGLVVFLFLRPAAGAGAALAAAALWATSPSGGELAAVSEMYSLWLLGLVLAFAAVWRLLRDGGSFRAWAALAFFVGLGCGVRTDFALLAPAFLYAFWKAGRARWALPLACFFALGLSIFLYLPLRSAQQPLIDWNDPEQFSRLLGSLLRRSHGGALDKLSSSYAQGENFASQFWLFVKASAAAFSWAGLPLAFVGGWLLARRSRAFLLFLGLAFAVCGPVFLYIANMPPNPHSVAIVEAHHAAPQAALLLLTGWGAGALLAQWPAAGAVLLAAAVAFNVQLHGGRVVKRWNLLVRDYATNLTRSTPEGGAGVVREDVPLFGLWERTLVAGARPDLAVVAQGLAASPWYQAMLRRQGHEIALGPLRGESDWAAFRRANPGRPLWAAGDVNLAFPGESRTGGLPIHLNPSPAASDVLFALYALRGAGDQVRQPDFFSSDLVSEYARAALREATARVRARDWDGAGFWLKQARRFDSEAPSTPFNEGYVHFQKGDLDAADRSYSRAARLHAVMLDRAAFYKTLPAVLNGLRQEAGEVWIHRGVVAERRGLLEDSRAAYAEALRLDPASAQAHFNMAVTYWNRDWDKAIEHLARAAEIAPAHEAARAFLEKARAMKARS